MWRTYVEAEPTPLPNSRGWVSYLDTPDRGSAPTVGATDVDADRAKTGSDEAADSKTEDDATEQLTEENGDKEE